MHEGRHSRTARRIVLAVISDLATDQRVHRVALALHERGCQVRVIGRQAPEAADLPPAPYERSRLPMRARRGKLMYIEFNIRLLAALWKLPADTLTANDLDTLLPCWIVAGLKRQQLVYDSHELFTEVPELIGRPLTRWLWKRLEGLIFPRLTRISVVSQSIADYYFSKYKKKPVVIRNLPLPLAEPPGWDEIAARDRVLLYQGALNLGRGIELMIEALEHLPDWQLWIAGEGDLSAALRERATASAAASRIRFWGRLRPEALQEVTRQARIGLSLEEDRGLNYRFALPNKLFDYIQCRVPSIVSNLPEMASVIQERGVGLILRRRSPVALAELTALLGDCPERYRQWVEACDQAARDLHWNVEKKRLFELYDI